MPRSLSILAFVCLVSLSIPLRLLELLTRHTALRSACWWTQVAAVFWILMAASTGLEAEPGVWLWQGYIRLLAATLALAPLVAVLGARWPGAAAWNLIVLSLLVVFSLPVLEQWLIGRSLERDRVGMDTPRFVFYCVVAAIGILNYLPTRFGFAAALLGAGLATLAVAVGPWPIEPGSAAVLTSTSSVLVGAAGWLALFLQLKSGPDGADGAWFGLRDGWGVAWASRFRDHWNADAERYGWPIRLSWSGFELVPPATRLTAQQADAAEDHFRFMLKRFAVPERFVSGGVQGSLRRLERLSRESRPEP